MSVFNAVVQGVADIIKAVGEVDAGTLVIAVAVVAGVILVYRYFNKKTAEGK